MPLNEDQVEAGKSAATDTVICCKHCHRQAELHDTIGEHDTPLFELSCPIDGLGEARTLGQWNSAQERAADMDRFLVSH